ncbi:hypothetical protein GQX74_008626 [Glossina fuscipes]|nr:hypothetical protein GQX74_008626 [Glossina fuscipes]
MEFENTSLLAESAGLDVSTEKGHKLNYSSSSSLKSKSTTAKIMSTLSSTLKKQEQKRLDTELKSRVKPHHQKQPMSAAERSATKKSLVILAAIFITSLAAMCYVYMICPELNDLQTFAIPGSLFLSILLGFLYRFPIALFLICFCSALGATLCYCLSNLVGRRLIRHFWPKKISEWSKHVEKHRDSLFNYMLFLRMTPILPNWFINLAAPVIGVPLYTFTLGTFCGVAPPSVIAIQAGKTLQKMSSSSDAFSWTSMGVLTMCACLSLVPGLLKNKLKKKIQ